MKKCNLAMYLFIAVLPIYSYANAIKGAEKLELNVFPVPVEIKFTEPVISMFSVIHDFSFGMVAGKSDHETLRNVMITGKQLKEEIFPRKEFEAGEEIGTCIDDCLKMYMSSCRILSLVNWKSKKNEIDYWGIGDVLENNYYGTKLIDKNKKIVLTVFCPFYDESYDTILNGTACITLEDLVNKKRIKSIPISTESGEFKKYDQSHFWREPSFSFGPDFTIYRESLKYPWLSVNNNLEYIDHLLKKVLNDNPQFFATEFVSIEIANEKPFAVTVCQNPLSKKSCVAIIQWTKTPAITPVLLTLGPDERIEEKSLTLSPSGKWAHFNTSAERHFLMYIDPDLPAGSLSALSLPIKTEIGCKFTWITQPEGFVIWNGNFEDGKLFYWDLSKVDVKEFLKK